MKFRTILAAGTLAVASVAGIWALGGVNQVNACIHPPKEFKYPIKAGTQKGLIFFADGYETMIIQPGYKVENAELKNRNDAIEGFTTVAWVIPVPQLPDLYEEANKETFSKLADFTPGIESRPDTRNSLGKKDWGEDGIDEEKQGIELDEKIQVGDYTIQPIKARGELGGTQLNEWLDTNGFAKINDDVLTHYLDNEFFWLAVKLHKAEGLPADGQVSPLKIGFKTDQPVYPLKINQGTGTFDLDLWLITNKEVDLDKSKAAGLTTNEQRNRFELQKNRETKFSALPEEIRKEAVDLTELKNLKAGKLFCYRFEGKGLGKDDSLSKMKSDLTFEWKPEKKKDDTSVEPKSPKPDNPKK